jgi:hypothetical protein
VTGGREDVTRALAEHREVKPSVCACGSWSAFQEPGNHDCHLADVLAALSDERLAQAEAKVERVEAQAAKWRANPDDLWRGFEAFDLIDRALSGDAAPRTDGDTR